MSEKQTTGDRRALRVAIIGAGVSGISMAIELQHTAHEFTLFERGHTVGGTWRDNVYPGLYIDVPGFIYTWPTDRCADWSKLFVSGAELQSYVQDVFDRHDLGRHTRFNCAVEQAEWTGQQWRLMTSDGSEESFDVLVHATGFLVNPRIPDIPGLATFAGEAFHSARWNQDIRIDGARVGVIGNGSTGSQLVGALAGRAAHLSVFMRTPQWICPAPNVAIPKIVRTLVNRSPRLADVLARLIEPVGGSFIEWAIRHDGIARRVYNGLCRAHLYFTVRDRNLRPKLIPREPALCKRPVMGRPAEFYRALQRPDVDLVTEGVQSIDDRHVITVDGRRHELDVLAFATGFHSHDYMRPIRILGEDGLDLDDVWAQGPRNYRSVAVAGFPNMFMIMGPHTPLHQQSVHVSAETQTRYILQLLDHLGDQPVRSVQPTDAAMDRWEDSIAQGIKTTIFSAGCTSWYVAANGNAVVFPYKRRKWRQLMSTPDWSDFHQDRLPA